MPLFFVALALFCLGARLAWEIIDPLQFWESKAWIYVRDAVTLGPAVGFALLAAARARRLPDLKFRPSVLMCAGFATLATFLISHFVLLGVPAVTDEAAYLWQGVLFNSGHLTAASGPIPDGTVISYVYDLEGRRVSVFFPGSALILALGFRLGAVELMNPLLVGALAVVTYWSARRLFDERVARIAMVAFALSPFTLFQGASFFSHVWTGLLIVPAVTLALTLRKRWEPFVVGLLLAAGLFSRPVSAAVAGVAIAGYWFYRWRRQAIGHSMKAIVGALPLVGLFGWYNFVLTGSVLTTAHRLFLPDEALQLNLTGVKNAFINLAGIAVDLNGLVGFSLAFILFAAWRGGVVARFLGLYGAIHLACYALYYNNGVSYGPRYLFEISPFLTMLVAVALTNMRWSKDRVQVVLGVGLCATLAIVGTRGPLFNDRARYLDIDPTVAALDGQPGTVFVTKGVFEFPDPMYAAFVHDQKEGRGGVFFVRDTPANRCEASKLFPAQSMYQLNMDEKLDGRPALHPVIDPDDC